MVACCMRIVCALYAYCMRGSCAGTALGGVRGTHGTHGAHGAGDAHDARDARDARNGAPFMRPLCSLYSNFTRANDALMELLSAIHALKGASSQRVIAVLPLFPYSRGGGAAGASRALIPRLFACAGCDHIITMDLHDPQFLGFFDLPVDNLVSRGLFQKYIQRNITGYKNAVIVSPDAGGAKRATVLANTLGMDFALVHKERDLGTRFHESDSEMVLVGDVDGKVAILVDDIVDTGQTLIQAAKVLDALGAITIYAMVTHAILSGNAIEQINMSKLHKVVVTNSVPQADNVKRCPKLVVLDVSPIFAEAIRRVHHGESLSMLFDYSL
ncbi:hypothetical protein PORY_002523 [Pneumocystis oryctolagi]|uniref:Uncharacterized protein n=1 Tax=Pneumocystis oryctolagi TaxID=42067 RepID=A0ACB7CGK8_9ASCO|nr:hypothetical protein PORY_002523 [Pneumocystis oryctolagi]